MLISGKNRELIFDIDAPASKSVYHRELIVRFLCGDCLQLDVIEGDNDDIIATKSCLKALRDSSGKEPIVLDCNESGSTLRFMIPVAAAYIFGKKSDKRKGKRLVFKTAGRLFERPIKELSDALLPHGIRVEKSGADRSIVVELIEGYEYMTAGEYVIDGSVSSQYISGLLMALTCFNEQTSIRVTGELKSVHYIELTEAALKKYGAEVKKKEQIYYPATAGYSKEAIQRYPDFKVEGDWSNGAFLLCLERFSGIRVHNLNPNSLQGDRAILEYFKYLETENEGEELSFDCNDIPDIVPYMATIAPFIVNRITFNGIGRLRIKESDRVKAVREQLFAVGVKTEETEDSLTVYRYEGRIPCDRTINLSSYHDHRMAMCAILLAVILETEVELDDLDCVKKSFPQLIDIVEKYMR